MFKIVFAHRDDRSGGHKMRRTGTAPSLPAAKFTRLSCTFSPVFNRNHIGGFDYLFACHSFAFGGIAVGMSRGSSSLSRLHNISGMRPGGFGVLTGDFGMGCVGFRFGEKGIGKRLKVSRMRNDAVLAVPECVLGGPDAVTVRPECERAVPESERAVPECKRVVPEPKRAVPDAKRAVPDAVEGTPPYFPHNRHGMSGLHALEKGQIEAFSAQAMAKVLSAMLSGVKLNLAGAIQSGE